MRVIATFSAILDRYVCPGVKSPYGQTAEVAGNILSETTGMQVATHFATTQV
jgi:hypothetical protein